MGRTRKGKISIDPPGQVLDGRISRRDQVKKAVTKKSDKKERLTASKSSQKNVTPTLSQPSKKSSSSELHRLATTQGFWSENNSKATLSVNRSNLARRILHKQFKRNKYKVKARSVSQKEDKIISSTSSSSDQDKKKRTKKSEPHKDVKGKSNIPTKKSDGVGELRRLKTTDGFWSPSFTGQEDSNKRSCVNTATKKIITSSDSVVSLTSKKKRQTRLDDPPSAKRLKRSLTQKQEGDNKTTLGSLDRNLHPANLVSTGTTSKSENSVSSKEQGFILSANLEKAEKSESSSKQENRVSSSKSDKRVPSSKQGIRNLTSSKVTPLENQTSKSERIPSSKREKRVLLSTEEKSITLSKEEDSVALSKQDKRVSLSKREKRVSVSKQEKRISLSKQEKGVPLSKQEKGVSLTKEKSVPLSKEEKSISLSKKEKRASVSKQEKRVSLSKQEKRVSLSKQEKCVPLSKEVVWTKEKSVPLSKQEKIVPLSKQEKRISLSKQDKRGSISKQEISVPLSKQEKRVPLSKQEKSVSLPKEEKCVAKVRKKSQKVTYSVKSNSGNGKRIIASRKQKGSKKEMKSSSLPTGELEISDLLKSQELKRLETTDGFWFPPPELGSIFQSRFNRLRPCKRQNGPPKSPTHRHHQSSLLEHRKKKLRTLKKQAAMMTQKLCTSPKCGDKRESPSSPRYKIRSIKKNARFMFKDSESSTEMKIVSSGVAKNSPIQSMQRSLHKAMRQMIDQRRLKKSVEDDSVISFKLRPKSKKSKVTPVNIDDSFQNNDVEMHVESSISFGNIFTKMSDSLGKCGSPSLQNNTGEGTSKDVQGDENDVLMKDIDEAEVEIEIKENSEVKDLDREVCFESVIDDKKNVDQKKDVKSLRKLDVKDAEMAEDVKDIEKDDAKKYLEVDERKSELNDQNIEDCRERGKEHAEEKDFEKLQEMSDIEKDESDSDVKETVSHCFPKCDKSKNAMDHTTMQETEGSEIVKRSEKGLQIKECSQHNEDHNWSVTNVDNTPVECKISAVSVEALEEKVVQDAGVEQVSHDNSEMCEKAQEQDSMKAEVPCKSDDVSFRVEHCIENTCEHPADKSSKTESDLLGFLSDTSSVHKNDTNVNVLNSEVVKENRAVTTTDTFEKTNIDKPKFEIGVSSENAVLDGEHDDGSGTNGSVGDPQSCEELEKQKDLSIDNSDEGSGGDSALLECDTIFVESSLSPTLTSVHKEPVDRCNSDKDFGQGLVVDMDNDDQNVKVHEKLERPVEVIMKENLDKDIVCALTMDVLPEVSRDGETSQKKTTNCVGDQGMVESTVKSESQSDLEIEQTIHRSKVIGTTEVSQSLSSSSLKYHVAPENNMTQFTKEDGQKDHKSVLKVLPKSPCTPPKRLWKVKRSRKKQWQKGIVKKYNTSKYKTQVQENVGHSKDKSGIVGLEVASNQESFVGLVKGKGRPVGSNTHQPGQVNTMLKRLVTEANFGDALINDDQLVTRTKRGILPMKMVLSHRPRGRGRGAGMRGRGTGFRGRGVGRGIRQTSEPRELGYQTNEIFVKIPDTPSSGVLSLPVLKPLELIPPKDQDSPNLDAPPVLTPQFPMSFDRSLSVSDDRMDNDVVEELVDDTNLHLYWSDEEKSPVKNSSPVPSTSIAVFELPSCSISQSEIVDKPTRKYKGKKGKPPGIKVTCKTPKTARKSAYQPKITELVRTFEFRKKTTRSPLEMLEMKRRQEEAIYDLHEQQRRARLIILREKRYARSLLPEEIVCQDLSDEEELLNASDIKPCFVVLNDFVKKLKLGGEFVPTFEESDDITSSPFSLEYEDDKNDEDWYADLEDVDEDIDDEGSMMTNVKKPHIPRLKLKRVMKHPKVKGLKTRNLVSQLKSPVEEPLKLVIKTEPEELPQAQTDACVSDKNKTGFVGSYLEFLKERPPEGILNYKPRKPKSPKPNKQPSLLVKPARIEEIRNECVPTSIAEYPVVPSIAVEEEVSGIFKTKSSVTDSALNDQDDMRIPAVNGPNQTEAGRCYATGATIPEIPPMVREINIISTPCVVDRANQEERGLNMNEDVNTTQSKSELSKDPSSSIDDKRLAAIDETENVSDDEVQALVICEPTNDLDVSDTNNENLENNTPVCLEKESRQDAAFYSSILSPKTTDKEDGKSQLTEQSSGSSPFHHTPDAESNMDVDDGEEINTQPNNNNEDKASPQLSVHDSNNSVMTSPAYSTSEVLVVTDLSKVKVIMPHDRIPSAFRYTCKRCGFFTSIKLTIESHIYSHIPGVQFQCTPCQIEFSSMTAAASHLKNTHPSTDHKLDITGYVDEVNFYDKTEAFVDQETSNCRSGNSNQVNTSPSVSGGQSPPVIISVVVSGGTTGNRTVRTGGSIRRFVCSHCGFSTNVKEDVEQHVSDLHPSQGLYACCLCNESVYSSEEDIKHHSSSVHPSRPKPYRKLPDYYDADHLAKMEQRTSQEELGSNVYRVNSVLNVGDVDSGSVDHKLKAKEYLDLQEDWKGKKSVEADSTTAADFSEDNTVFTEAGDINENLSNTAEPQLHAHNPEGEEMESAVSPEASMEVDQPLQPPEDVDNREEEPLQMKIVEVVSLSGQQTGEGEQSHIMTSLAEHASYYFGDQTAESLDSTVIPVNTVASSISLSVIEPCSPATDVVLPQTAPPLTASEIIAPSSPCTTTTILPGERGQDVEKPSTCVIPITTTAAIASNVPAAQASREKSNKAIVITEAGTKSAIHTTTNVSSSLSSSLALETSCSVTSSVIASKSSSEDASSSSTPSLTSSLTGGLPLSYKCKACKVHTPYLLMMVKHLKSCHPAIRCFSCPYCTINSSFPSQKQLRHHVRSQHPVMVDKNEVSLSKEAKKLVEPMVLPNSSQCRRVGNRLVLEEDIHTCTVCSLRMTSLSNVYDHLNETHSDLFEFVCPVCKAYKNKFLRNIAIHCGSQHSSKLDKDKVHVSVPKYLFTILTCISRNGKYIEKEKGLVPSSPSTSKSSQSSTKSTPSTSASCEVVPHSSSMSEIAQTSTEETSRSDQTRPSSLPTNLQSGNIIPKNIAASSPTQAQAVPSAVGMNPEVPIASTYVAVPLHSLYSNTNQRSFNIISSSLFDTSSLVSIIGSNTSSSTTTTVSDGSNSHQPLITKPSKPHPSSSKSTSWPSNLPVLNVPSVKVRNNSTLPQQQSSPPPTTQHNFSSPDIEMLPETEPNPDAFKIFNLRPSAPPAVAAVMPPTPTVISSAVPSVFPPASSSSLPLGYIPGAMAAFPAAMVIPPMVHSAFPFAMRPVTPVSNIPTMAKSAVGSSLNTNSKGKNTVRQQRHAQEKIHHILTSSNTQSTMSSARQLPPHQLQQQPRHRMSLSNVNIMAAASATRPSFTPYNMVRSRHPPPPNVLPLEHLQHHQLQFPPPQPMAATGNWLPQFQVRQAVLGGTSPSLSPAFQSISSPSSLQQQQPQQHHPQQHQPQQHQLQQHQPQQHQPHQQQPHQQQPHQQQPHQQQPHQPQPHQQQPHQQQPHQQQPHQQQPQDMPQSTSTPATTIQGQTIKKGKRGNQMYQCPYCTHFVELKALDVASHIQQLHPGRPIAFRKIV